MYFKNLFLILCSALFVKNASGFETEKSVSVSAGAHYNNNIVEYAPETRDIFKANTKSAKFSISTLDDMVISGDVNAGITMILAKKWKTGLSLSLKGDYYTVNPICSDYSIGGTLTQRIPGIMWIYLKYAYTPYIYVSKYRDYESVLLNGYTNATYQDMSYMQQKFNLTLRRQIGILLLGAGGEYYQNFYNKYFTEYDIDAFSAKGITGLKFKNVEIELGYSGKVALKRTLRDTLVKNPADCSYKGHSISLNTEVQLPKVFGKKNKLECDYTFDFKRYNKIVYDSVKTDSIVDPYHAKRKDYTNYLNLKYTMKLNNNFDYKIFGSYNFRSVKSDVYPEISKEKNYTQFKAGILIDAALKW